MRGRKPKRNAIRRGGAQPVTAAAEVIGAPVEKPEHVAVNPVMSACWDALVGDSPGFEQQDAPLLESYCYWYAVFRQACESTMTLDGRVSTLVARRDPDTGIEDMTTAKANPDLRTAEKATVMLRQLGDALNISPTARVRSGLMRAMTASTQAEMVTKTLAGFEQFKKEQARLNEA